MEQKQVQVQVHAKKKDIINITPNVQEQAVVKLKKKREHYDTIK